MKGRKSNIKSRASRMPVMAPRVNVANAGPPSSSNVPTRVLNPKRKYWVSFINTAETSFSGELSIQKVLQGWLTNIKGATSSFVPTGDTADIPFKNVTINRGLFWGVSGAGVKPTSFSVKFNDGAEYSNLPPSSVSTDASIGNNDKPFTSIMCPAYNWAPTNTTTDLGFSCVGVTIAQIEITLW